MVWAILTLHQTYYLVDVLALYVLLMLAAPIALFLLCEGQTRVLLGVSWLTWFGFQVFPAQTDLPWTIAGNNLFHLSAWQVLFFTAMAIGFHRQRIGAAIGARWHSPLLLVSGIGVGALILVYTDPTGGSAGAPGQSCAHHDAVGRPIWRMGSSPRPTCASAAFWPRSSSSASCSC